MPQVAASCIWAGAGLTIIAVCSVPAAVGIASQLRSRAPKDNFYQDHDGQSKPEAIAAFSNKWPKVFAVSIAALGFASSFASAVLTTQANSPGKGLPLDDWFVVIAWALLEMQAISLAASHDSVQAYNIGLWAWISSLVLALLLLVQDTALLGYLLDHHLPLFVLKLINLTAVLGFAAAVVALPRRPDVFMNDIVVDRMYTASAYSRYTWSWCEPLIRTARKKRDLEITDLPRPSHNARARDLSALWRAQGYQDANSPMWVRILWFFRWQVFCQWSLCFFRSFVSFAPYWVTHQILETLQERQSGEKLGVETWLLVFWLGFAILADAWLMAIMFWLSWSELLVPVRGLLSAIIVEKSMRRKNVKQAGRTDDVHLSKPQEDVTSGDNEEDHQEQDGSELKSQQSIVNLIGVDAKRVSDFAAFQLFFPTSFAKFAVAIWFLVTLLGWTPVLAGLAALGLITPINVYCTRVYTRAQDTLMKLRDQKLALVNESLLGMRQIKFSALEQQWEDRILAMREKELAAIWSAFKGDTALCGTWVTSPIALAATSLCVYAWIHKELKPSVAFVSIGIFKTVEIALSIIPELTTDLIDAKISMARVEDYLNAPELIENVTEGPEIRFDGANITWPADDDAKESEKFVLRNIDLRFPTGELSVISGKTGAGKSLLLAAILGEADLLAGKIYAPKPPPIEDRNDGGANRGNWIIPASIGFVGQIPWIENATLKDNILFGLPLDQGRLDATVEACALTKDLDMLTDGLQTELGANGVNLSGGQKWRVTLARAVYSRAGILVLDDIFSAVDAHVGRHIFEKCLTGPLCRERTRILVTHHIGLCAPKTNFIVELGEGTVLHAGHRSELEGDGTLQSIKSQEEEEMGHEGAAAAAATATATATATAVNSYHHQADGIPQGLESEPNGSTLQKVPSTAARQFVEDEARQQGAIKKHVYAAYFRASGGWFWWITSALFFVAFECMTIGRSWWLKVWTSDSQQTAMGAPAPAPAPVVHETLYFPGLQHTSQQALLPSAHSAGRHSLDYYIWIYVIISVFTAVIGTVRMLYLFIMSLKASRRIFTKMTYTVLRAPLRWLDTVPVGRILNRFTADFNIIDSRLATDLSYTLNAALGVVGVCVAAMFVSPYMILLAIGLLLACTRVAFSYLDAARPNKRLESTTKSPIFESFGSALTGVATIRGFDKAKTYVDALYTRIDDYGMATWYLWLFNRWMGWRMSIFGSVFSVVVAILILADSEMDAALAGFTLSFALEFSESVLWAIRNYATVELDMNAAERVVEYSELPTEDQGGQDAPAAWPSEGRLEVSDLVVSYAEDLPPVLKGLSFEVKKSERIGVVGRTGAGKSSLTLALFRFLEARSGSIRIDGIDVSRIKLQQLRSRLAIIPQDPVLFSGTVRSNLDPFDDRTDAELYDSLQRVHLLASPLGGDGGLGGGGGVVAESSAPAASRAASNTNPFGNLSSPIAEGGLNLSQGQRQLLCLARAIIARPRVMVLDEATSAVDMATDGLIQRSIREEFTGSTLIVIAHRLSTIADFDRILVLSDGKVAEFGTPKELWEKGSSGVFRAMCEESGEKDKLSNIVFG